MVLCTMVLYSTSVLSLNWPLERERERGRGSYELAITVPRNINGLEIYIFHEKEKSLLKKTTNVWC